ncbi:MULTISPECIES: HAMP domain-containing sensor histidine kinase [unclassified Caulobacter]|uniref:sensor histidine kinase n=1 Tax=unclassified Caulobacter TaxID=2648921 RepID=UPI0009EC4D40
MPPNPAPMTIASVRWGAWVSRVAAVVDVMRGSLTKDEATGWARRTSFKVTVAPRLEDHMGDITPSPRSGCSRSGVAPRLRRRSNPPLGGAPTNVAKPLRRLPLGRPSPSWRGRADHRRGGRHSGQDQPCERAAEAAHELRTPLAILAARIDSLPPGDQVAGMRRDIERMRAMVDQLLMVARLEASAARSEDLVDLVDLTRDVVADCSPLALAQDRQLALAPYCDTLLVRGDARLLHSALRNLVENAIRAEPPGGRINITVGPEPVVCVIDHGPGVPEEDRERIFEPFWRRRDGHPGAGLGLAIVREVARAHDGQVAVADTPGGGATFRFSWSRQELTRQS